MSTPRSSPATVNVARATLNRKLIYAVAILVLFSGQLLYTPILKKIKDENDLGQTTLGRVDTGGFVLNLMLLGGFRGIAANMLWMEAQDLQKQQEYDKMSARVNLITKLQPHFLSSWTFLGWNLAYNVSVEWDAPEDKYEWIKRGINFLKEGVNNNRNSPDLHWDVAWTYYHKMGFSDEALYLRRLFYDDPDDAFKSYEDPRNNDVLTSPQNDNFLLAHGWFHRAMAIIDRDQAKLRTMVNNKLEYVDPSKQRKGEEGDIAFFTQAAHSMTKYAVYLEKESVLGLPPTFGDRAKVAWTDALNEWKDLGRRQFKAFNDPKNNPVYLDDVTRMSDKTFWGKLPETRQYWTNRFADQYNYPYWEDRCQAERKDVGVDARRLFHQGRKNLKGARFAESVQNYEVGLAKWKALLDEHLKYRDDELNKEDTGLIVNYYLRAMKQLGKEPKPDTPFYALGKKYEGQRNKDPFDALEAIPDSLFQEIQQKYQRNPSAPATNSATPSSDGAK